MDEMKEQRYKKDINFVSVWENSQKKRIAY